MLHQDNFAAFIFTGKDITSNADSPPHYWFQKHLNHWIDHLPHQAYIVTKMAKCVLPRYNYM